MSHEMTHEPRITNHSTLPRIAQPIAWGLCGPDTALPARCTTKPFSFARQCVREQAISSSRTSNGRRAPERQPLITGRGRLPPAMIQ
jgi:hypothetical protein